MKSHHLIPAVLVSTAVLISGVVQARTVIQNKGSDTLVNVAQAWAEEYQKVDSEVAVAVSGSGSGTGIAAMINGTVDIANASRSMKDSEIKQAKDRGQNPVEHVVGYDALAVYLHPDNPASTMSIEQLKSIYGRKGGQRSGPTLGLRCPVATAIKLWW